MLRLRGIPTALNVDGIEWEREKWGHLAKGAFHVGARLTARYATALVCDSIAIQQRWERDFSRTGTYIPYGGTTPLNEECPFDLESRKYVLVVARLVPENSITQFFESAAELAKHYRVIIVGCSGYGGRLDDAAAELDRTLPSVQWLGQVRDDRLLLALWRHAGTYFHGHSVGGTNPALVQAMHCGAPTVACDTVFNREVLGNAGVFVEPTRESIIAAVMSVMNDSQLQDRLAQAASNRARQRFTWDIVCSRYNELFDELYRQKNHLGRNAC
jgi:glycosyltransferase involved in cell wall biosynthesis